MLDLKVIRERCEGAKTDGFGLEQFDDLDALIAEVERLRERGNCGKCKFKGNSRPCSVCIWSGLNGSDYFEPLTEAPEGVEQNV